MRRLMVSMFLLAWLMPGCRKPVVAPPVAARVLVRFLDRDAVLVLAEAPPEGTWRVMNAGQWDPLPLRWKPGSPRIGAGVVGRTAPDWVLLEDPSGESHRVILRGPGPEELARRNERLDPDELEALTLFGLLWALTWSGH